MHHSEGNIRYVIRYAGEIRTMTTYPLQLDTGELLVMDGVRQYELCQVDEVEGKYGIYPNRMNFVVGGKCRAIRCVSCRVITSCVTTVFHHFHSLLTQITSSPLSSHPIMTHLHSAHHITQRRQPDCRD